MNRNVHLPVIALVLLSLVLSACAAPAAPTAVPAPAEKSTQAPAAPTQVAATASPAAPVETAPTGSTCQPGIDVSTIPVPDNPKRVTISFTQEPDNAFTEFSTMSYSIYLMQMIGSGLAYWNDQGEYVPQLAAEIPSMENGGISADGLTITWHLKPCQYWSDGVPLTSKDVKYTWEALNDPDNTPQLRYGYDIITSIDTPDDQTAVMHFSKIYPAWTILFTNGSDTDGPILPAHMLEGRKHLEKDPFIHQPTVSSGAFVMTEWIPGDHMILTANPNFVMGKPKLDQIAIKFVPDPATAMAALQTGDIDFSADFSVGDTPALEKMAPDVQVRVNPSPLEEYYYPNYGTTAGLKLADGTLAAKSDVDGPCALKDIKVRKAIALGINRQAIADTLLYGKTTIPESLWANTSWYNTNLKPIPYDPDQANKLLDEAGYKLGASGIREGTCDGKLVKLSFSIITTNKQLRVDETTAMQSDLKKIGIELKPNLMPGGTFFGTYPDGGPMPTGKFDITGYMNGFSADPDPGDYLTCAGVPSVDNPSGRNFHHLCDPKMDELIGKVSATVDPTLRKQAMDELQQYIADQYYIWYLYSGAFVMGYSSHLALPPTGGLSGWAWNVYLWDKQ